MASSKSIHASSGRSSTPASLSSTTSSPSSVYSENTSADRDSRADSPDTRERKQGVQSVPTIQLPPSEPETLSQPNGAKPAPPKQHETANTPGQMASAGPVLMSSQAEIPRKRSKLNRLSSFFPSLINTSSSGLSANRKPSRSDSPAKERSSTLSDWEAQLRNRFDSPSSDKLSLGDSLSSDGKSGHKKHASLDALKMGKLKKQNQQPQPPLPISPAISAPSKTSLASITPTDPGFNFTDSSSPTKLTKPQPKRRSSSLQHGPTSPQQNNGLTPRGLSPPSMEPRMRSSSAQPPNRKSEAGSGGRQVSAAAALDSRPSTSHGTQSPSLDTEKRGRLRRSWFPSSRSRSNSIDTRGVQGAGAWTLGPTKADYNTAFLEKGDHVPELWNESGNVLVYLHPKESGKGPSFKVMSFVTDYSLFFQELIEAESLSTPSTGRPRTTSFTGQQNLTTADAERLADSPPSPPLSDTHGEMKLYLASNLTGQLQPGDGPQPDLDRLISFRNMFALLTGQPLVGNKAQPTIFAVLMRISSLLQEYDFTSVDGSTFGDSVDMSFGFFMEGLAVADVRHSREKTLEALLLGERMKSWELYNEAFAHAVGRYPALRELSSPLWDQVSTHTRQRLERGHFELLSRQANVNNRLENFEFPALFSGLANSTTQYKNIKFGRWKTSFGKMRSFVLGYYKTNFGSWPPKARSKKNPFTESGLNRQVLKILYSDLCALYDLIVDRQSLTPRSMDSDKMEDDDENDPMSALRRILTEYDQSSPPVLPPIPYDTPRLPDIKSIKENYHDLPAKDQKKMDNNYKEHEFLLILSKSYDFETLRLKLPFLEAFKDFEEKEAKGKPISEIADQRIGYWLFLYVVIQSLPMLVVDAPGLKFTEGVEYFLCQPPKGQPPWTGEAAEVRKRWYEVSGGAGYVELSEDTIEFSIEGIYHRSHCWVAAKQWEAGMGGPMADPQDFLPPLEAPQSVFADNDPGVSWSPKPMERSESPTSGAPSLALRPRGASPAGRPGYRSSVALGLEPVSLPGEDRRGSIRTSRVYSGREGSIGPRPTSAMLGRSRSSGNMQAMGMGSPGFASPDSRTSSRQDSQMGGSTFDDILKDIDKQPKKKKSFLFG